MATVVVLAESGPVFTEDFGSTAASEAVETTGVGVAPGGADATVLAGGNGAVAVAGVVAHVDSVTEEETWVDAASGLEAGAELTTWVEADVDAGTGRGAAGAWTEAETGGDAGSVFVAEVRTSALVD